MRQRKPHHPQGLRKVQFENGMPVGVHAVGNTGPAPATSHIVDQDIGTTECGNGGGDRLRGLIGFGHVAGLRAHRVALARRPASASVSALTEGADSVSRQPSTAKALAVARPIPRLDPVISTTLSLRCRSIKAGSLCRFVRRKHGARAGKRHKSFSRS